MPRATNLFAINNIPLLRLAVTVHDVASLEVRVLVPGFVIGLWIGEISINYCRSSDTQFTSHIICCDVFAFIVYQSEGSSTHTYP